MIGTRLLIVAIIVVFVIAFIITMVLLNASAKKIIDTNSKLVKNQNKLLEQNRLHEDDKADLKKRIDELEGQLRQHVSEEVKLLQAETRQRREHIELTADMDDMTLMAWLDQEMEKTRLYTDTNLTLKTLANTLGLTQRRLAALFKNHPKYANLGDYLNEKRFILACRLLREQPNWTIEAVGTEAGFGSRRTFQMEMKRRLGITPLQYRQGAECVISQ